MGAHAISNEASEYHAEQCGEDTFGSEDEGYKYETHDITLLDYYAQNAATEFLDGYDGDDY